MCRISLLLCLFSIVLIQCKPAEKYTTKYDNVDLDQILKSDRLINSYFQCVMTGKGCTPDGKELRKDLPDALENGCASCSEKQKEGSRKIIHFLIENKRNLWDEIEKKFDPKGKYRKTYEAQIKKEKLDI